jgi:hypothetical protein
METKEKLNDLIKTVDREVIKAESSWNIQKFSDAVLQIPAHINL